MPLDNIKAITQEERDILSVESPSFLGDMYVCLQWPEDWAMLYAVTSISSLSLFPRTLSQPTASQQQPITSPGSRGRLNKH